MFKILRARFSRKPKSKSVLYLPAPNLSEKNNLIDHIYLPGCRPDFDIVESTKNVSPTLSTSHPINVKYSPLKSKKGSLRKTRNEKIDNLNQYILSDKSSRIDLDYTNSKRISPIMVEYILGTEEGTPVYLTGRCIDEAGSLTVSYLTFRLDKIKSVRWNNYLYKDVNKFLVDFA